MIEAHREDLACGDEGELFPARDGYGLAGERKERQKDEQEDGMVHQPASGPAGSMRYLLSIIAHAPFS